MYTFFGYARSGYDGAAQPQQRVGVIVDGEGVLLPYFLEIHRRRRGRGGGGDESQEGLALGGGEGALAQRGLGVAPLIAIGKL